MAALLLLEHLHGALEVVIGELGQLGSAVGELFLDDVAVLFGDGVPDIDVDVSAAGSDQVVGEGHLLGNLGRAVGGVGVHVAFQTVDNALLHGGDGLTEGHGHRGGAHGGQAVDVHGAVGNADLHTLHVVGGDDFLVGLHAAQADVEVKGENVDAVVVFDVLAQRLDDIRLAHIGVLLKVCIQHRGDQSLEVDVVVGQVGGIFAGDPVGAVHDLLQVVLVDSQLAGAVGLDLDSAVGALKDAGCDLLHLDGELFGGCKNVAELEGDVEVVLVIGESGGADTAEGNDHHEGEEKREKFFHVIRPFLLQFNFFLKTVKKFCEFAVKA